MTGTNNGAKSAGSQHYLGSKNPVACMCASTLQPKDGWDDQSYWLASAYEFVLFFAWYATGLMYTV